MTLFGRPGRPQAQQISSMPIWPTQAGTMPMQVAPAQAGIDLTTIMNLMVPLMIVVMMMGMMSKAFAGTTT